METDKLRKSIANAMKVLENYRSFGPMVNEGIEAFKRIDECIAAPTPELNAEAKVLIGKLMSEIGAYQGYVPSVAYALDELKTWYKI